jgi:hypothetical protein
MTKIIIIIQQARFCLIPHVYNTYNCSQDPQMMVKWPQKEPDCVWVPYPFCEAYRSKSDMKYMARDAETARYSILRTLTDSTEKPVDLGVKCYRTRLCVTK